MTMKNKINYEKKRYQYLITFNLASKRHLKALKVIESYREEYDGTFLDAIINIICSAEGKFKKDDIKDPKKEDMVKYTLPETNKEEKGEPKTKISLEEEPSKRILDQLLDEMYGE